MDGRKRGVRYVIFDIFGNVVGKRSPLDECWKRSDQATKAMWTELNSLDAKAITFEAIEREDRMHQREMAMLKTCVGELVTGEAAP
jgi:hypothetical protein